MDLNELQSEVVKLLSLLNDRQPGLFTWNQFLADRLKSVVTLAAKAGIKVG